MGASFTWCPYRSLENDLKQYLMHKRDWALLGQQSCIILSPSVLFVCMKHKKLLRKLIFLSYKWSTCSI